TGWVPTAAGTYYWVASYAGDSKNFGITSGASDEPVTVTTFSISGSKYDDLTENGFSGDDVKLSTADSNYVSVTINLYKNGGATPFLTTTTDASGNYSFTGLGAGTYTVSEVAPTGWKETANRGGAASGPSGNHSIVATG